MPHPNFKYDMFMQIAENYIESFNSLRWRVVFKRFWPWFIKMDLLNLDKNALDVIVVVIVVIFSNVLTNTTQVRMALLKAIFS